MPGLKTGMENGMFWSEIGSGFREPDGTTPPRIPRSNPPPPGTHHIMMGKNRQKMNDSISDRIRLTLFNPSDFP